MSTIRSRFEIDEVLKDITSISLSEPNGTYGVKRNDTDAIVVPDGTVMSKISTGIYEYTFSDPAYDLTYTCWIEWSYGGETFYEEHTKSGPTSAESVTITSSDINTRARQITHRESTTELTDIRLTTFILEAVREIAKRSMCLKSSTTGILSANVNTISRPSDMIKNIAAIDSLYLDSHPLDQITFNEWLAGKINGYAYRNGTIYVTPTQNSNKSYTIYYRKEHSSSVATIELPDDLEMAVIYLVVQKIYDDYGQDDEAIKYKNKYENELDTNAPAEVVICEMRHDSRA